MQNTPETPPECEDILEPPSFKDAPEDMNSPEYDLYIEKIGAEMDAYAVRSIQAMEEKERLEKRMAEQAALDTVVFNLSQAFENPPSCVFSDHGKALDRNIRILNAAFEYYLEKAAQSNKPDGKIRLAAQMQSQMVRSIDAWRRLEEFHTGKTK